MQGEDRAGLDDVAANGFRLSLRSAGMTAAYAGDIAKIADRAGKRHRGAAFVIPGKRARRAQTRNPLSSTAGTWVRVDGNEAHSTGSAA